MGFVSKSWSGRAVIQNGSTLYVPPKDFNAVKKGRLTVPLDGEVDLAKFAGLPLCSIATLHSGENTLHRVVGPAISQTSGWVLPVLYWFFDPTTGLNEYKEQAKQTEESMGP